MIDEEIKIPLKLCKQVHTAITKYKIIKETFESRKEKLKTDYKRMLSNYFVEYIDHRNLIDQKFVLDSSHKNVPIILDSHFFGDKEEEFMALIKYFKNNPVYLAENLVNSFADSKIQKVVDFIFLGLYPNYLNSTCWCQQNLKLYTFMRTAILSELGSVANFQAILNKSNISEKIFKALLKNIEVFKFFKHFVGKCVNYVLQDSLSKNKQEVPKMSKSFRDSSDSNKMTDKFTRSNSAKYQTIIQNYLNHRQTFATSANKDSKGHEVSMDQINVSMNTSLNTSSFQNQSNLSDPPQSSDFSERAKFFVRNLIKCIRKHLPIEVKYFFFLLKLICDYKKLAFKDILNLYLFQRLIINNVNDYENIFSFEEMQNFEKDKEKDADGVDKLKESVTIIITACNQLLNSEEGSQISESIAEVLTSVPDILKHQELDQLTFAMFPEGEGENIIVPKIDSGSRSEIINEDSDLMELTEEGISRSRNSSRLASQKESQKAKQNSKSLKEKKSKSVIMSSTTHNIKQELLKSIENYYENCNFHNEGVCISLGELGDLLEIFNKNRNSHDSSLELKLINKINEIVKDTAKIKQGSLSDQNIYILFFEDIKQVQKTANLNEARLLGTINQILASDYVNDEILEVFCNRSIKDLVDYGLNNWMFGEVGVNDKKKEFLGYKYDLNLRKVYISNMEYELGERSSSDVFEKHKADRPGVIAITPKSEANNDQEPSSKAINIIQGLEKAIAYYTNLEHDLVKKHYQLGLKKFEIAQVENQKLQLKDFRRSIMELNVCRRFESFMKDIAFDLCIQVNRDLINSRDPDSEFIIGMMASCKNASSNSLLFTSKINQPPTEENLAHNHFTTLESLLGFLKKYDFILSFVEDNKYFKFLKNLLQHQKEILKTKVEAMGDKTILAEYKKVFGDEALWELFENFMSSKLHFILFPSDLSVRDEGFRITCEILGFMEIKDFTSLKNSEIIAKNLQGPIMQIKKICNSQSYSAIIKNFERIMTKIVGIITSVNSKSAGNDELLPVLVYCIVMAKPNNYLTTYKFLELFMPKKEANGIKGFILTQINSSIKIIESISKSNYKGYDFDKHILENEINLGLHFMRIRNHKSMVKKTVPGIFKVLI